MRRRQFITFVGGAAAAWLVAARAEQPPTRTIGFLGSRSPGESSGVVTAFRQGLGESGFVEGQNVAIAFRWAEGHYERLPALAAELANLHVDVLFAAGGPPSAFAAKSATPVVPIVFSAVNHPVELGLVASLNRPGGNITGMSMFTAEITAKNLNLLKEMAPTATIVAYLMEVRLSTVFQTCLISGSVLPQIARLHHFSPFCLPSSVAHIDFQALAPLTKKLQQKSRPDVFINCSS